MNYFTSVKTKDEGSTIDIRRCEAEELRERSGEIADLYIRVFGGAPWYERVLVLLNDKWTRMGRDDEMERLGEMLRNGTVKQEDIKPFYTRESVRDAIYESSALPGFAASIAIDRSSGRVVGASWGVTCGEMPSGEKRNALDQIMGREGLPPDKTFYFDECFVDIAYRGIRVGSALVRVRGTIAIEQGSGYFLFRTINPVQLKNLASTFGRENLSEVYSDPDDIQEDRKYYLIELARGMT